MNERKGFFSDAKAVSPVIAVLVLIVVAVIGAIGVGALQTSLLEKTEGEAEVGEIGVQEINLIGGPGVSMAIAGHMDAADTITSKEAPEGSVLHGFNEKYPKVQLNFMRECCGLAMYAMDRDVCDMGIGRRFPTAPEMAAYPDLRVETIGKAPLAVIANANGPFATGDNVVADTLGSIGYKDGITGNPSDVTDDTDPAGVNEAAVKVKDGTNYTTDAGTDASQVYNFTVVGSIDAVEGITVEWAGITNATPISGAVSIWNNASLSWESCSIPVNETGACGGTWTDTTTAANYINNNTGDISILVTAKHATAIKLETDLVAVTLKGGNRVNGVYQSDYTELQDAYINTKEVGVTTVTPVIYPTELTTLPGDWFAKGVEADIRLVGDEYGTGIQGMFSLYLAKGPGKSDWMLGGGDDCTNLNDAIHGGADSVTPDDITTNGYHLVNSMEDAVAYVAANPNAIAFMELGYAADEIDGGEDGIVILGLDGHDSFGAEGLTGVEDDRDIFVRTIGRAPMAEGDTAYVTGFGGPMFTPVNIMTRGELTPNEYRFVQYLYSLHGFEVLAENGFLVGEDVAVGATCPFHTE